MIESSKAEAALEFLRKTDNDVGPLSRQARLKAHMLKHVEGLLVKAMANEGVSVTLRKDYARADDRYLEALKEDAEAHGEWSSLLESRDAAKTAISLYQTSVKDRL